MNDYSMAHLKELEQQANDECSSAETTAHHGGAPGRPFWNCEATQFMYVPSFQFAHIPGCRQYRFRALDEAGKEYSFTADKPTALLTPIWKDLPESVIRLTVTALDEEGRDRFPVGARTFFRLSPFRADWPRADRSYRETVKKAFDYVMSQEFILHWLEEGTPDPTYDLNFYPSKIIPSLIGAMSLYARICPEKRETAMRIATAAADYLLGLTPGADNVLPWLPPTYSFAFCPDPEKYGIITDNYEQAVLHQGTVMMIYPACAGSAYLTMEKETGDGKYLEAALKIGDYYEKHVEENGSWKLVRSEKTGEPVSLNYADPLSDICPFLRRLYERTGEEKWKELADGGIAYVEKTVLPSYNWEGQFEDSVLSSNYDNLTHFGAEALASYYAKYRSDDEKAMQQAEDLLRYVEDQFVVWHQAPPWYDTDREFDSKLWHLPGVLEQYHWYTPIDGSAAVAAKTFVAMYKAGRGDLYLAKALALADQIVLVQDEDGQIPTHWSDCKRARDNFWINCMFGSMRALGELAEYDEERRKQ